MGLSCGMHCVKLMLFAFNFVFWVAGIGVFGIGIWSRIKAKDWDSLLGENDSLASASNLMIAAGALVMVIGFLGCCGAIKESKCLLIMYAISLILIFILEIAGGIYAYTQKDEVLDDLKKNIKTSVEISYGGTSSADKSLTEAMDWFQENVECCGAAGPNDWSNSKWYRKNGNSTLVPSSCCKDKDKKGCNKGSSIAALKDIYEKGCVDAGEDYVKDHLLEIGGVGVGIAFVQVIGIVFSIMLCRKLGSHEKI